MKKLCLFILTNILFASLPSIAQTRQTSAKGKLFIIGGGDRSAELMRSMLAAAAPGPKDYVVVLPMSGENPDTSFYYLKEDLQPVCTNAIVNFNFTKEKCRQ